MSRKPDPRHRRSLARAGFSLLEMIVAITIMTVLVGATVPVASKAFLYKARNATNAELQELSEASAAFFYDVDRLPLSVAELLVDPPSAGWNGPYLPGVVTDSLTGLSGYQVDAWSRPYSMSISGDVLTIASMGADATPGTSADLTIDLDVTYIRREKTLARLATINLAVVHYNAQYLSTDPLPANYAVAYSKLVSRGFLPASTDYQVDAWGNAYVEIPLGGSPVVEITSTAFN